MLEVVFGPSYDPQIHRRRDFATVAYVRYLGCTCSIRQGAVSPEWAALNCASQCESPYAALAPMAAKSPTCTLDFCAARARSGKIDAFATIQVQSCSGGTGHRCKAQRENERQFKGRGTKRAFAERHHMASLGALRSYKPLVIIETC